MLTVSIPRYSVFSIPSTYYGYRILDLQSVLIKRRLNVRILPRNQLIFLLKKLFLLNLLTLLLT